jgi:hypothetical protein
MFDCVIEGLDFMCFLCSCSKGCILCFVSIDLIDLVHCLFIWIDVFCCEEYSKWNHPVYWCYVKVKFLHTNYPGYYQLHAGSVYIYI